MLETFSLDLVAQSFHVPNVPASVWIREPYFVRVCYFCGCTEVQAPAIGLNLCISFVRDALEYEFPLLVLLKICSK